MSRFSNSFNVSSNSQFGQQLVGLFGSLDGFDGGGLNNKRDFRNILDSVSSGSDEGGEGRGSQGRDGGESSFVSVDMSVPSSPGLGWGKSSTTSAHVTESSLSGSRSTSSRNTRDTSDGSSSSPRFSSNLVTGVFVDGIGLSVVSSQSDADVRDDIHSDWCGKHPW